MQAAFRLSALHEFVRRGADDALQLRKERLRLVDQGLRRRDKGRGIGGIAPGLAAVPGRRVKVIVDDAFDHDRARKRHLLRQAADHAEIDDELGAVDGDQKLRRRGRGDLPRPGVDDDEAIIPALIAMHFKTAALFDPRRAAVLGQHRVHFDGDEHSDGFHDVLLIGKRPSPVSAFLDSCVFQITRTRSTSGMARIISAVSSPMG